MNDKEQSLQVSFWDSSKIPMDIVCNGFSMKKVILEILEDYQYNRNLESDYIDQLAEDIKDAFAVKLGIKQGK